jgi:GntR family transcriptional regulator
MGRSTKVELLSFDYVQASGAAAAALGVGDHESLQRSVRVRSVDGLPFSYLLTHVPERIGVTFSAKDLADRPLLELLERSGVKVERATQRISAGLAAPDVARALGVKTGSPLIELVRTVYDRDGRGVEHLHALYRPDRYSFEIDLVRSGSARKKSWSALPLTPRKPIRRPRPTANVPFI